jgi:protein TonB
MATMITSRPAHLTTPTGERLIAIAGVTLLHLVLGWALLLSLAPRFVQSVSDSLNVFDVPRVEPPAPPPPEPPVVQERDPLPQPKAQAPQPEGPAAPAAPKRETPATRPTPSVDVPPPVAAGIVPASGGRIERIGPGSSGTGSGTGSGGQGQGTGSGSAGTGAGGGGAPAVRARLRSGRIVPRDYPRAANGDQGTVVTRLSISASGAVTGCTVTRSSGNQVLDSTTCRLIQERMRFNPARDAQGREIADVIGWQQRWWRD